MNVRTWKQAVCAVIGVTLLSMLASVLIAEIIASFVDRQVQLLFALAVPAISVPIFAIPLVRANLRLFQARAELEKLVRTDSLTGLANRRSFLEQATDLFSSPAADQDGIAVMMVDIDHFKRINDRCGHDVGDRVLKAVANAIVSVTSQERLGRALVGRIGGEEFAVLARGVDSAGAVALAERLCQAVRRAKWSKSGLVVVPTVSIGVATRAPGETFAQVLKAADVAVYDAKALGRDRWRLSQRDIDAPCMCGALNSRRYAAADGLVPPQGDGLPGNTSTAVLRSALPA